MSNEENEMAELYDKQVKHVGPIPMIRPGEAEEREAKRLEDEHRKQSEGK